MLNVISIDVEEYFHAANLEPVAPPRIWHRLQSRVEYSTNLILDILEKHCTKATFFILGYIARRHPELCKKIAKAGHEIASHGYGHQIAYQQTPRQFYRDIRRTKLLIEDITGEKVIGYRAPNFSIQEKNLWAYEKLIEAGYTYDSSLYPIAHPRYGNVNRNIFPEIITTLSGNLYIFPLAVLPVKCFNKQVRFPIAGGAYFRLLPRIYWMNGLRMLSNKNIWFITYLHPWELDGNQPQFNSLNFLTKLRHYGGIKKLKCNLEQILDSFEFTSLKIAAKQSFTNFEKLS